MAEEILSAEQQPQDPPDKEFDEVIEWIMEHEEQNSSRSKRGYRGGGSNWGTNKPEIKTKEQAKEYYRKRYLPLVKGLPSGLKSRALQLAINTGDPYGVLMVASGRMSNEDRIKTKNDRKDKVIDGNIDWEKHKSSIMAEFQANPEAFLDKLDKEQYRYYNVGLNNGNNPPEMKEFHNNYFRGVGGIAKKYIKANGQATAIQPTIIQQPAVVPVEKNEIPSATAITQQPKISSGERMSISDFALKIKTKYPQYKDMDDTDLVSRIISKYPQYKEQVAFEKKKLETPSLPVVQDTSVVSSPTPKEGIESPKPVVEQPLPTTPEEPIVNPVKMAKEAALLANKTKTSYAPVGGFAMGSNTATESPDEEAIAQSNKIKEQLKKQGIDANKVYELYQDVPDEYFEKEGFRLEDEKNNPENFRRKLATVAWQTNLSKSLKQEVDNGDLPFDEAKGIMEFVSKAQGANSTYKYRREDTKKIINYINTHIKDELQRGRLLKQVATDRAFSYGQEGSIDRDKELASDSRSKYLTKDQVLALQFLEDTEPEVAKGYESLLVDKSKIGAGAMLMGYEEKAKRLEMIGLGIQQAAIKEEIANLVNRSDNAVTVSESDLGRYEKLYNRYTEIEDAISSLETKYPTVTENEADKFAQEILGQKTTGATWAGGMLNTSIGSAIDGIFDLIGEPFRSDEQSKLNQLLAAGSLAKKDVELYVTNAKSSLQNSQFVATKELQDKFGAIVNNPNLSKEQQFSELKKLLKDNVGEWGTTSLKGGKINISPSSLFYSVTGLATTLAPYIAMEAATGGGATAGIGRKLLSSFNAALVTGFHDSYAASVQAGEANPMQHALRTTAINAAFMAGAGTPHMVRKMLQNPKTAVGELISKMTDEEIGNALLKAGGKGWEKAIMKTYDGLVAGGKATLEGLKGGAKFEAIMTGGKMINNSLDGKEIDPEHLFKEAIVGTLAFAGFGAVAGSRGQYKKLSTIQSDALFRAAKQPELFLEVAAEKLKNREINTEKYNEVKENIEAASEVMKKVQFVDNAGKPLSQKESVQLMFLKMEEFKLQDKIKGDVPDKLKEKTKEKIEEIKAEQEEVYSHKEEKEEEVKGNPEEISKPIELSVEVPEAPSSPKEKTSLDLINSLEGKIPNMELEASRSNPDLALREIADQALGFTRNGEERVPHPQGGNEAGVRAKYGDEIVDAAIAKFPAEKISKLRELEKKISDGSMESINENDIVGISAEEIDNKVRFTEKEKEIITAHNQKFNELKELERNLTERLSKNDSISEEEGSYFRKLSNEVKEGEASLPKGEVKGRIKEGVPSFSDMESFEYYNNVKDWNNRVVDIGGVVYVIKDGKMKAIPFVSLNTKSGKYELAEKPDRAMKYGDGVPEKGEFKVLHSSPNGKIEKFDEDKLGKGFQREEHETERFEGVYSNDNTADNKILGRGYGEVHEYSMRFDNSISENKAEKLLREHEKSIGKRLTRKESSAYIKSLGYDMIFRSEGDGTYTYIGLDVNKIKPANESINSRPTEAVTTTVPTENKKSEGQGNKGEVLSDVEGTGRVGSEATTSLPKDGDTVVLPPQIKGGTERKMIFSEGEWKQQVGDNVTKVGKLVQEQAQKAFGGEVKAEVPAKSEVKDNTVQPKAEVPVGKYETKAKAIADKIKKAELPDFLKGISDPNIKTKGITAEGIKETLADAVVMVGKLLDKGVELKEAIKQAAKKISDYYTKEGVPVNEKDIEKGFEDYYSKNAAPPKTVKDGVVVESDSPITILSHKGLQEVAQEFGLEDVRSRERITDLEEFAAADKTISQWQNDKEYSKNIDKLITDAEKGEALNFQQRVILQQHIANLRGKAREVRESKGINSPEYDKAITELDRVKKAGETARSTAGAALRVGELGSESKDTIEDWMAEKKESAGVDELTSQQKEEIQKQFQDFEAKLKKETELREKFEEEASRLKAELALKETAFEQRKTIRKKSRESLKTERENIIANIKEKLRQARGETTAVAVPYAKELIAIAPDVAKLVRNLLDTGTSKLSDVIDTVHETLKDAIPAITRKDVHDIIAGEYNEKKATRSELARKMQDLRDEAKLINKLEALLNGEPPKNNKAAIERNQEIKKLREQIKNIKDLERAKEQEANEKIREAERETKRLEQELEKELRDKERAALKEKVATAKAIEKELNKKTSEEITLKTIKSRNESLLKQIEEDIKNGNFETKKRIPFNENEALKKANPKLWAETMDAIAARKEVKHKWELAKLKDEMEKQTLWEKTKEGAVGALATARAITAGFDLSFLGVQAWAAVLANKRAGAKSFIQALRDAPSPQQFNRQLEALHNSPYWDLIEKSGLDVLEPASLTAKKVEELFDKNLLSKDFKIKGKSYNLWKYTGGIAERAFTSMGNNLRVLLFTKRVESMMKDGMTYESHPQEYKDAARVINEMTARGHVPRSFNNDVVSALIWSPKMIAASFNVLGISDAVLPFVPKGGKGYYASLTPKQRNYAIGQMVKAITTGVGVMAAFALGDLADDVEFDPKSVRFGNITIGNKSYNAFGRYSGYAKLVAQSAMGEKVTADGELKELNRKERVKLWGTFLRGKLTPAAGYTFDYARGEQYYTRQKMEIANAPKELFTPLAWKDVAAGVRRDGMASLIIRTLPSLLGMTVSDKRDFEDANSETTGFTKEEMKQPDLKVFADKEVRIPEVRKFKIKDKSNPLVEREVTDEEFDKYVAARKVYLKESIKELMDYGAREEEGEGDSKILLRSAVPAKDLTAEQLKKWIRNAASEASEKARKEVLGEIEVKSPTIKTDIDEY